MRYTFCALIAALVATVTLAVVVTAPAGHADSTNLLANGGFDAGATGWTADSWGTNDATVTLVPDAHSGSTGARVTMTSYTDGDAKWAPDPTTVTSGSSYTYTDWSRSDSQSHLWAQFIAPDGSVSYSYLHAVAASATWTPITVDIPIPQNVSALRVFHVLAGVGTLTIDDTALTADPLCAATTVDGLTNGDFEDACPSSDGVPAGWAGESGQGNAAFTDSANAASGTHAVTITDDADGQEAGITTSIAGPRAGLRYSLAFSQSGTTYVYAYLTVGHSDGTTSYLSLMSAPATRGTWSRYTDAFVTPSDMTSLDVTLATSGAGQVTLDAVALSALANQNPATFRTPMVSITFDDGDSSVITGAARTT